MTSTYAVTAVGNAIVDILSTENDQFLTTHGLNKGTMTLVDGDTSQTLFEAAGTLKQQSGGSAANTVAGIAALGGKCAYIGKVSGDALGQFFKHDMNAAGIAFDTTPGQNTPTARCMIFVTPDANRTMATYLGISTELTVDDLDEELIAQAQVTYLEGYLFDKDTAKKAFQTAAELAHKHGKQAALTLSDPFCVDRHRDDFLKLVQGSIDILFANEHEIKSLYQTDDLEHAIETIGKAVTTCAITRGAEGATIIHEGQRYDIKAAPVEHVVDTTGAGDMFAAGFLYGMTHGMTPQQSGDLAAKAAAEIISHIGARPMNDMKELLAA